MISFCEEVIKDINSELKEEVAFLLEDGSPSDVKIFIPTGSTILDYIISNQKNGGIPVGKITEISGLEGTGKTLVAMQICANTQKMGGIPIFIDTENAFNTDFAERVGLNTRENFIYVQPGSCEDVFKAVFKVIHRLDAQEKAKKEKYPFVTIVWDSVASAASAVDIATENTDPSATVGLIPRIISKNIRTLLRTTGRRNLALLFLNQLRMNIKAMFPGQDKWVTPGGKAIPFAASVRIRLTNSGKVKVKEDIVGIQVKAKCVKTRFGPPYRDCTFPIYFTHGVDDAEGIIDILEKEGFLIKKHGPRYYFKGDSEDKALKKVDFKKKIMSDKDLNKKIYDLLEKVMVRPMIDPNQESIEVISDEAAEAL